MRWKSLPLACINEKCYFYHSVIGIWKRSDYVVKNLFVVIVTDPVQARDSSESQDVTKSS